VQFFRSGFQVSERRACRVADVPRTTMRYRSRARDQSPLRLRLRELTASRVRYGYRRLHILLRREGWRVNAKRVYRLYREEGLSLRLKRPKKRVSVPRVTPPPAEHPNERWSFDFLKDSLADGRPFRVFTIVDNVSKVSPAIVADFSINVGSFLGSSPVLVTPVHAPSARPLRVDRRPPWTLRSSASPAASCLVLPNAPLVSSSLPGDIVAAATGIPRARTCVASPASTASNGTARSPC
jgi:putative transposase